MESNIKNKVEYNPMNSKKKKNIINAIKKNEIYIIKQKHYFNEILIKLFWEWFNWWNNIK